MVSGVVIATRCYQNHVHQSHPLERFISPDRNGNRLVGGIPKVSYRVISPAAIGTLEDTPPPLGDRPPYSDNEKS
jgi:hypothetical protein